MKLSKTILAAAASATLAGCPDSDPRKGISLVQSNPGNTTWSADAGNHTGISEDARHPDGYGALDILNVPDSTIVIGQDTGERAMDIIANEEVSTADASEITDITADADLSEISQPQDIPEPTDVPTPTDTDQPTDLEEPQDANMGMDTDQDGMTDQSDADMQDIVIPTDVTAEISQPEDTFTPTDTEQPVDTAQPTDSTQNLDTSQPYTSTPDNNDQDVEVLMPTLTVKGVDTNLYPGSQSETGQFHLDLQNADPTTLKSVTFLVTFEGWSGFPGMHLQLHNSDTGLISNNIPFTLDETGSALITFNSEDLTATMPVPNPDLPEGAPTRISTFIKPLSSSDLPTNSEGEASITTQLLNITLEGVDSLSLDLSNATATATNQFWAGN